MENRKKTIKQWWNGVKQQRYIKAILITFTAVFLYFIMLGNVIPEQIDVHLSDVAEEDIRSPITIENRQATDRLRAEAVDNVEPNYVLKQDYAETQGGRVNDIFELIGQVKNEQEPTDEEADSETSEEEDLEEKLATVNEALSSDTSQQLSDTTIRTLLETSDSQLVLAKEATSNTVFEVMSERIEANNLQEAKDNVDELINISTVSNKLRDAMVEVAQFAIIPNYVYDRDSTERLREEASESVEAVMIREGQLLVKQGDIIDNEIYAQLRLVGLLDESLNIYPYVGLAMFVVLLMGMMMYFIQESNSTVKNNNSHFLLYLLIFIIAVCLMRVTSFTELLGIGGLGYAVPVAAGTMLLTLLLNTRIALFSSVLFAIVGTVLYSQDGTSTFNVTYGFYLLVSSLAGALFLSTSNRITRLLRAGFLVSCINVAAVMTLLFIKGLQNGWLEVGFHLGSAAFSGVAAAVLTIGLLPFFEAGFSILSVSKLIELSNPNHPLLRKVLTEAPGTYHHSVVVGNLAEAACERLGENGLLARVGAYYHDVGKTKRPHFFIENQMSQDNPHDKISPQLSKTIIISHPYDGADLLREHKMPKEIVEIAEQHHGTSLLKYFYHKANQEVEQPLPESQFRYPGPKPQNKVACIVAIADSVEAAVRSMQKPTPDKIEALVNKIIKDKLEDGQFDESEITLRELNDISLSMLETLKGTFHQRIEYPDELRKGGKEHGDSRGSNR
ncbi:HD family phosphohydrolase [Alkalicoccobacillus murimartini]|uniref:Nucleotidyltransferase with HDIG domain n=1 Tax=Alkalicoccobacillus murimartini TaxID=171685 RepID=A0ABT9YCU0_9BACI|nr:HD family phosphohydrolase [Alkalicoccobacillus murimartini]MDQ0205541.1 putative nucleotidyltransferase with HDIG domain [Alkalicoccobacillus murimartini]